MGKKHDKDWILQQLDELTGYADELVEVADIDDAENDYRPMTILKLSMLSTAVDVYTKIATRKFTDTYYIDVFAGSGITKVRGEDEYVIGSAIIAATMFHTRFREWHFFEQCSEKANALRKRLDYLAEETDLELHREDCHVHDGDSNEEIPRVLSELEQKGEYPGKKGMNLLSFVDNEGVDAHWDTVERLTDYWGDMVITFPPVTISRREGKDLDEDLREFYGNDSYIDCNSEDEYIEQYLRQLEDVGKEKNRDVRIDSGRTGKRFYYNVLYATRKSPEGSPYIKAFDGMQERIERLDGDDISNGFDIHRGDQTTLDLVPESSEVEEDDEEDDDEEPEVDDDQQSLGDF